MIKEAKNNSGSLSTSLNISKSNIMSWYMGKSNETAVFVQKYKDVIYADNSGYVLSCLACECGGFGNPLPNVAKDWVFSEVQFPEQTLESWGYHKTGDDYKGKGMNDWTRPQSHKPQYCGYGSFRDHALIIDGVLQEQNYDGWSPRGEPNPELNTYWWPYPLWPIYAFWWHQDK